MLIDCSQPEVTVESTNVIRRKEVQVTVAWVPNVCIYSNLFLSAVFSNLDILNHSWAVPIEFYVVSRQMLLILNTTCSALGCFCISEDYMLTYCFASWALINISVLILSTAGLISSELFLFCPEHAQSRRYQGTFPCAKFWSRESLQHSWSLIVLELPKSCVRIYYFSLLFQKLDKGQFDYLITTGKSLLEMTRSFDRVVYCFLLEGAL